MSTRRCLHAVEKCLVTQLRSKAATLHYRRKNPAADLQGGKVAGLPAGGGEREEAVSLGGGSSRAPGKSTTGKQNRRALERPSR